MKKLILLFLVSTIGNNLLSQELLLKVSDVQILLGKVKKTVEISLKEKGFVYIEKDDSFFKYQNKYGDIITAGYGVGFLDALSFNTDISNSNHIAVELKNNNFLFDKNEYFGESSFVTNYKNRSKKMMCTVIKNNFQKQTLILNFSYQKK